MLPWADKQLLLCFEAVKYTAHRIHTRPLRKICNEILQFIRKWMQGQTKTGKSEPFCLVEWIRSTKTDKLRILCWIWNNMATIRIASNAKNSRIYFQAKRHQFEYISYKGHLYVGTKEESSILRMTMIMMKEFPVESLLEYFNYSFHILIEEIFVWGKRCLRKFFLCTQLHNSKYLKLLVPLPSDSK